MSENNVHLTIRKAHSIAEINVNPPKNNDSTMAS
jgi:hypothetical protein